MKMIRKSPISWHPHRVRRASHLRARFLKAMIQIDTPPPLPPVAQAVGTFWNGSMTCPGSIINFFFGVAYVIGVASPCSHKLRRGWLTRKASSNVGPRYWLISALQCADLVLTGCDHLFFFTVYRLELMWYLYRIVQLISCVTICTGTGEAIEHDSVGPIGRWGGGPALGSTLTIPLLRPHDVWSYGNYLHAIPNSIKETGMLCILSSCCVRRYVHTLQCCALNLQ